MATVDAVIPIDKPSAAFDPAPRVIVAAVTPPAAIPTAVFDVPSFKVPESPTVMLMVSKAADVPRLTSVVVPPSFSVDATPAEIVRSLAFPFAADTAPTVIVS
jgi:hypothetical protein